MQIRCSVNTEPQEYSPDPDPCTHTTKSMSFKPVTPPWQKTKSIIYQSEICMDSTWNWYSSWLLLSLVHNSSLLLCSGWIGLLLHSELWRTTNNPEAVSSPSTFRSSTNSQNNIKVRLSCCKKKKVTEQKWNAAFSCFVLKKVFLPHFSLKLGLK